jgi:hypothetical protein
MESKIVINSIVPRGKQQVYLENFFRVLREYSFRYKKRDEIWHEGCRRWIDEVQIQNPRELRSPGKYANLIKAEMDGFFQKDHAKSFYTGFVEGLQNNL